MKFLLAVLTTAFLAPRADTLAFNVQQGEKIKKTIACSIELDATKVSIKIGESELPEETLSQYEVSMANWIDLTLEDEYVAFGKGRPTGLVRRFQTVKSRSKTHDKQPNKTPLDKDETFESPLAGKAVEFGWNAKDESWQCIFKGDEGDPKLLETLKPDMDCLALMHPGTLKEGEKWSIEPKRLGDFIKPGGELPFPQQPESGLHIDFTSQASGTIEATYAGTREVKGRKLGVVKLEVRVKSMQPADPQQPLSFAVAGSVDLAGEYLWDLERGRLASYEIHGPVELVASSERAYVGKAPENRTMKLRFELGGRLRAQGSFE